MIYGDAVHTLPCIEEYGPHCRAHAAHLPVLSLSLNIAIQRPVLLPTIVREWKQGSFTGRKIIQLRIEYEHMRNTVPKPILHVYMFKQSLDSNTEKDDNGWSRVAKIRVGPGVLILPVPVPEIRFRFHFVTTLEKDSTRSLYSNCKSVTFPAFSRDGSILCRNEPFRVTMRSQYHARSFLWNLNNYDFQCDEKKTRAYFYSYRGEDLIHDPECSMHPSPSHHGPYSRQLADSIPGLEILGFKEMKYDALPMDLNKRKRAEIARMELTIRLTTTLTKTSIDWPSANWHVVMGIHNVNCELYRKKRSHSCSPELDLGNNRRQLMDYCVHHNKWWDLTGEPELPLPVRSSVAIITINNLPADQKLHLIAYHSMGSSKSRASPCKTVFLLSNRGRKRLIEASRMSV